MLVSVPLLPSGSAAEKAWEEKTYLKDPNSKQKVKKWAFKDASEEVRDTPNTPPNHGQRKKAAVAVEIDETDDHAPWQVMRAVRFPFISIDNLNTTVSMDEDFMKGNFCDSSNVPLVLRFDLTARRVTGIHPSIRRKT